MDMIAWLPDDKDLQVLGAVWVHRGEVLNRGKWLSCLESRITKMIINTDEPLQSLNDFVNRLKGVGLLHYPFPFRPKSEEELGKNLWRYMPHLLSENLAILDWLGWVDLPKEPLVHTNPDAEYLVQEVDIGGEGVKDFV